jgi:hypothetical protein
VATAGPAYASAATSVPFTGSAKAWTNPVYATGSTSNLANAAGLSAGAKTEYLEATGYGFALPSTARVVGITVEIRRAQSASQQVRDQTVGLVVGGLFFGSEHADTTTNWPVLASIAVKSYGGSADTWDAG